MSYHLPGSHEDSLKRLVEAGVSIAIRGPLLFVSVPYLDEDGHVQYGYLADPLNMTSADYVGLPANHQMFFAGAPPFGLTGLPLSAALGGAAGDFPLADGSVASFHFSMKRQVNGQMIDYPSLFDKVMFYRDKIAGPAISKYPGCELSAAIDLPNGRVSPFVFPDTMSAISDLEELNAPFYDLKVAIVGVGGTGAYLLDFLAKTPVKQIHIIDDDIFEVKNSYRAPGVPAREDFSRPKVEYFAKMYSGFHREIIPHPFRLNEANASVVNDMNFVFVCVDKARSRIEIASLLKEKSIPFIDTGLGLQKSDQGLRGMIRTTLVDEHSQERVLSKKLLPSADVEEDIYNKIVQIAELNCINACMAMIRFKQLFGFIRDERPNFHSIYVPHRSSMFSELVEDVE